MQIERIPFQKEEKEQKKKKSSPFRFIRFTLAICAVVFVIAFFVTMAVNTRKLNSNLAVATIPTYEPFPTYQAASISSPPVDLVANTVQNYQDDAPQPVAAPALVWQLPAKGDITTGFSETDLVYDATMNDWRVHLGVDFSGNLGSSVFAAADGLVTTVGTDDTWGTYITVQHADGYVSKYCNLQANPPVKKGDTVTMGQVIAGMGTTASAESADPPHLHFEVTLNGKMIDPMSLFQ